MTNPNDSLAAAVVAELLTVDQMVRNRVSKALPSGMELSHFAVLNHLTVNSTERTPAQLAATFKLTRGAMTNTLNKLEWMGYVHVRPDWDDARRKMVSISPAGRNARDAALARLQPIMDAFAEGVGTDKLKTMLPILRDMRIKLGEVF